jgi:hypothetical protein
MRPNHADKTGTKGLPFRAVARALGNPLTRAVPPWARENRQLLVLICDEHSPYGQFANGKRVWKKAGVELAI